ncbi:transferrin-binding protein-like solute binding protein [Histophilus somni]|uniref:transferrin-binding protein-like solute binding protein n=2 Tax=Histophilus somni TaxID=731 RepID=UPI00273EA202|nr:transferrin-binding protein-like solute binding protein [Histophilus somni]
MVEEINSPALGYATEIPRRNISPMPTTGTKESNARVAITAQQVAPLSMPFNSIKEDFIKRLIAENTKKNARGRDVKYFDDTDDVLFAHDGSNLAHKRDLQYVRVGYVLGTRKIELVFSHDKKTRDQFPAGWVGYVFYQGTSPAVTLPTQTVTYKGYWDFVSDAFNERTLAEDFTQENSSATSNIPGNQIGATSMDALVNRKVSGEKINIAHSAEFTADFGSKKLSGELKSNGYVSRIENEQQDVKTRYKIDADIKGNRFVGSATAQEKSHTIFGKDADKRLEGGFFGPKAEELAGKFLTDDNSLFVVFGAKRESKGDEKLETRFDAVKISTDSNKLEKETMDTFGNVAYLVLDGRQFPLVPESNAGTTGAGNTGKNEFISTIDGSHLNKTNHENHKKYKVTVCCSNLVYVKFGSYGEQTTANDASNSTAGAATTHNSTLTNGHLFLTGERTSLTDMAKQSGAAKYIGTWQANFLSSKGQVGSVDAGDPRNDSGKSRAEFDVNFGGKTVTGKFFDADGIQPALTMDSTKIEGNGFSGTAKTTGSLQLDKGSTGAGITVTFTDAKVDGAFYGPNAEEIGGTITSNGTGDKVGGVFGAKRQELSQQK